MQHQQDRRIIVEHVTDPQGPADIAAAFDLILRAGDKRRAGREAVAATLCEPLPSIAPTEPNPRG